MQGALVDGSIVHLPNHCNIRKKFRDVDPEFDRIDNYPGFGYRWRDEADGKDSSGPGGKTSNL